MQIINVIKITILALVSGLMLTSYSHAGDLEITMDIVRQSDAKNITDSITREIKLPKEDMESVRKKQDGRSVNNAVEDSHHMGDHMSDAMEDSHHMRDHMSDAMESGHHMGMENHMSDARDDSQQVRDDMNDSVEDSHHMGDHMNGSMR